jgi:DNA modification methylase
VDYGDGPDADRLSDHEFVAWCRRWVGEAIRLLTAGGSLWVLVGERYADYLGVVLRESGLHRRSWIVWHETFGVNRRRNFGKRARHLIYTVKDRRRFVFHEDAVRVQSARQRYGDRRADPRGKVMANVWTLSRVCGAFKERLPGFPTQLPLDPLRPIVRCASDPGDLVIDPFAGSATSGVVALESGRRFLGIDRSGRFVKRAAERLRQVTSAES